MKGEHSAQSLSGIQSKPGGRKGASTRRLESSKVVLISISWKCGVKVGKAVKFSAGNAGGG